MKSYNHLWEQLISPENIKLAIQLSSLGKRKRSDVKKIVANPDKYVAYFQEYAENFENKPHVPKEIYDGISRKKRIIIVPWYCEQVIHHMVVNVLKPIFLKGMYEHSYGSLPNKGVHKAKNRIESWIRHDERNVKYYLKMDVKKYFNSIPHDILKEKLSSLIHDSRFLSLLFKIIDVIPVGIPLGFYTSQWLANWYLTGLDHYIKESLGAAHYIRYMDDMVIFGANKRKLHRIREAVENYLHSLGLLLKSSWRVERFSYGNDEGRDLDFMGFRFFRTRTILRKSVLLKASRKAKRISKKRHITVHDCRQMLSYKGWFSSTDTYRIFQQRIKPHVDFRKLRKMVGLYDRQRSKNVA
jgi:RNA-directed DNA polymerase